MSRSTKNSTTKPKTVKHEVKNENVDFTPQISITDEQENKQENKQTKNRAVKSNNVNQNNVIKSKIALIIDILSNNDDGSDLDERTLRRNVNTSLKHLRDIVSVL